MDAITNIYPLLSSLVVPRPIAWVSTTSRDGVGNLAPHSFFTIVCVTPPLVAFSSVGIKDTVRNLREVPEFVVNLCAEEQLAAVNRTSAPFPPQVDEADELDITMERSACVQPMRVADSPAAIECTLEAIHELGDSTLVIGRVRLVTTAAFLHDSNGRLDPLRVRLLSRLGGDTWGLPPETRVVPRPRSVGDALKAGDISQGQRSR